MNWHLGLRRISAVFWGFCAAFIAGLMIFFMFESGGLDARAFVYMVLCLIAIYAFYRLTNWIIGGFFSR